MGVEVVGEGALFSPPPQPTRTAQSNQAAGQRIIFLPPIPEESLLYFIIEPAPKNQAADSDFVRSVGSAAAEDHASRLEKNVKIEQQSLVSDVIGVENDPPPVVRIVAPFHLPKAGDSRLG